MQRLLYRVKNQVKALASYGKDMMGRTRETVRKIKRDGMSPRQRRALLLASASFVLGIGFCVFMAWLIASIAANPDGFKDLVNDNLVLATIAYALVNTLQVFAAFIPGEPLELVAGYLFGTWGGLAVVSVGLALGEAIVFIAVKHLGTRFVHLFVSQEKLDELALFKDSRRLNVITFFMMFIPGTPKDIMTYIVGLTVHLFVSQEKLDELALFKDSRRLNVITFFMMFIPGTPKDIMTYIVGLTPMTLGTWMAISIPARMLSIVASTVVGAQAAEDNWGLALLIFAITCVVSLFGMAYYVSISRQARQAALIEELGRKEWEASGARSNDATAITPSAPMQGDSLHSQATGPRIVMGSAPKRNRPHRKTSR